MEKYEVSSEDEYELDKEFNDGYNIDDNDILPGVGDIEVKRRISELKRFPELVDTRMKLFKLIQDYIIRINEQRRIAIMHSTGWPENQKFMIKLPNVEYLKQFPDKLLFDILDELKKCYELDVDKIMFNNKPYAAFIEKIRKFADKTLGGKKRTHRKRAKRTRRKRTRR